MPVEANPTAMADMAGMRSDQQKHAMERREAILRAVFDLSPSPMWMFDSVTLRFLAVNQVAIRTYGFSEAEFLSMSLMDIRSPAEIGRLDDYFRMPEASRPAPGIWRHRTKDGREIDVDIFARAMPEWGEHARLVRARDVTIERRAIRALEASERRFRDIFEHTTGFICIHDFEGTLLAVNEAAAAALEYSVGDLIGTQFRDLFAPELRRFFDGYLQRISRNGEDAGYISMRCRSGAAVIWQYRNRIYSDSDGSPCVIAHAQDVTAASAAKRALRLSERRLRTVADTLPVQIAYIDVDRRFVFANEVYRLLHDAGAAEVVGRHVRDVLGEERYALRAPYIERAMNGEFVTFQEESGEGADYRCVEATFTPELGEDGASVIGMHAMMQDVSVKKREEHRLIRLARIDSLTGLLNRAGFYERLENAVERSRDQGTLLALFYLDIDHFKHINDSHGHAVGDALLRAFAARLAGNVRASDVAARLGGDEFTLVMEGIANVGHVRTVAANLIAAMDRPFELGNEGLTLSVGSSIGIAIARAVPIAAAELVRRADSMLYVAKKAGRGTYRIETIVGASRAEGDGGEG